MMNDGKLLTPISILVIIIIVIVGCQKRRFLKSLRPYDGSNYIYSMNSAPLLKDSSTYVCDDLEIYNFKGQSELDSILELHINSIVVLIGDSLSPNLQKHPSNQFITNSLIISESKFSKTLYHCNLGFDYLPFDDGDGSYVYLPYENIPDSAIVPSIPTLAIYLYKKKIVLNKLNSIYDFVKNGYDYKDSVKVELGYLDEPGPHKGKILIIYDDYIEEATRLKWMMCQLLSQVNS
tara:strand:+ start:3385 stop:4089 length:705 start_codon:yes stop_codon:yes gene_type:complete